MKKEKQYFDWEDGQDVILHHFLIELVARTHPDYEMVGKALTLAYLAIPEGKQEIK